MSFYHQLKGNSLERVYHVIVLSNFARGFDKYSCCYDKAAIPESTFPDKTFVLTRDELGIGIEKASRLLTKLGLAGNRLLVLEAKIPSTQLQPNLKTGKGRYLASARLPVSALWYVSGEAELVPVIAEEAFAQSMALLSPALHAYEDLKPRTVSVLPVAQACQANCRFCFSESSASLEQVPVALDLQRVRKLCQQGALQGAERFVLTGGGEPGLVAHDRLIDFIRAGRETLGKVVLITNGIHLAKLPEEARAARLSAYVEAGLSVLAISRHHASDLTNRLIMGVDTRTDRVLGTLQSLRLPSLRTRLICVLQQGGVEDVSSLKEYLDYAVAHGVGELCFKELYVSSTLESAYHAQPGNIWSREHQVSLSLVTEFCEQQGFTVVTRLPWGAPVYRGEWEGQTVQIAAYSEPSLFWERASGLTRSWNIMADGECLASLEDPNSDIANHILKMGQL